MICLGGLLMFWYLTALHGFDLVLTLNYGVEIASWAVVVWYHYRPRGWLSKAQVADSLAVTKATDRVVSLSATCQECRLPLATDREVARTNREGADTGDWSSPDWEKAFCWAHLGGRHGVKEGDTRPRCRYCNGPVPKPRMVHAGGCGGFG
jgi:hypothetical protein